MTIPELPIFAPKKIDWSALTGGRTEAAWLADRERKVLNMQKTGQQLLATYEELKKDGRLVTADFETVCKVPYAAWWYLSLAGYSQKTLNNIKEVREKYNLMVNPATIADALFDPIRRIDYIENAKNNLDINGVSKNGNSINAFVEWINSELKGAYPKLDLLSEQALSYVSMIAGGRIIGQGQNDGGNAAVLLVKEQMLAMLGSRSDLEIYKDSVWQSHNNKEEMLLASSFKINDVLVIEFIGGAHNPDMVVRSLSGFTFVIGEIKGRKDTGNSWESWMPTVTGNISDWKKRYPKAARIYIGTLIDEQMITGISKKDKRKNSKKDKRKNAPQKVRIGLQQARRKGALTDAFNITKVIDNDKSSVEHFRSFVEYLCNLADALKELEEYYIRGNLIEAAFVNQ